MCNNDMSDFDCRANVTCICAGFESDSCYSPFYLKQLKIKILTWLLWVLTPRTCCRCGINWMFVLNHLATDCSLLPATFQHLRFGIKFVFSSKIEIIDEGEVLNSSHGCSTHNMFPFFCIVCLHLWMSRFWIPCNVGQLYFIPINE